MTHNNLCQVTNKSSAFKMKLNSSLLEYMYKTNNDNYKEIMISNMIKISEYFLLPYSVNLSHRQFGHRKNALSYKTCIKIYFTN